METVHTYRVVWLQTIEKYHYKRHWHVNCHLLVAVFICGHFFATALVRELEIRKTSLLFETQALNAKENQQEGNLTIIFMYLMI